MKLSAIGSLLLSLSLVSLALLMYPTLLFPSEVHQRIIGGGSATEERRVAILSELNNKVSTRELEASVETQRARVQRAKERVERLQSQVPFFGSPPRDLQEKLEIATAALQSSAASLAHLTREHEALLTEKRALSPVFSKMALDEVRSLWFERQKNHAGWSYQMWKWDVFFSVLFERASGDEGLAARLVDFVVRLFVQLTWGTVAALVDFLVRLPWWIREYDLFGNSLPHTAHFEAVHGAAIGRGDSPAGAIHGGEEGAHAHAHAHAHATMPVDGSSPLAPRFFAGGLFSFLQALVFYAFVALGVVLAAVLQVGLIWSPLIALALCAMYGARHNRNNHAQQFGNFAQQQQQQRYGYRQHQD